MTILVISSNSIGIKDFRLPILKEFIKRGKNVVILGPHDKHSEDIKNNILSPLGISYIDIPINNTSFNPIHDIRTIFQITRCLLQYNPDYVINYTMKPVLYGTLVSILTRRKNIFSFVTGLGYIFTDDSIKIKILRNFLVKIYALIFFFNKKVFFQNKDDLKCFDPKTEREKFVLIPGSGVDMEKYKFSPLNKNIKKPSFLFIGRLLKHKGIIEYLYAAKEIKKKYPHLTFSIVGDFSNNPSCISSENLESWISSGIVSYYGYQEDVRKFIKECTVFVLPSYREGLSRSILEAMSMGRPIITTNVPGCRDVIVEGESGFLVERGSVNSLTKAMEQFIQVPSLASIMGINAHQRVKENYNLRFINKRILFDLGFFHGHEF